MAFVGLKQKQLFEKASLLRKLNVISAPQEGWIRFFRSVLSLSSYKLAERLTVSQARISNAEKAEINKSISLKTLEKIANALNCDLYYCFVPKESVEDYLRNKASEKAKEIIEYTSHTMRLEDQEISQEEKKRLYEQLVRELMDNPKRIW